MKLSVTLAAVVAALSLTTPALAASHHPTRHHRWGDMTLKQKQRVVAHEISVHRPPVRWWVRTRTRQPLTAAPLLFCRAIGIHTPGAICLHAQHLVKALHVEQRLDAVVAARARPLLPAWFVADMTCIHGYEGAWNANTGNGYYGGVQMDVGFQSTYGPEFVARYGTADRWPIIDQLVASYRAYTSGRGFEPWPNTARACGLL